VRSEIAAQLLLVTSEVALRRYYMPPATVARILRAADPVITVADGRGRHRPARSPPKKRTALLGRLRQRDFRSDDVGRCDSGN